MPHRLFRGRLRSAVTLWGAIGLAACGVRGPLTPLEAAAALDAAPDLRMPRGFWGRLSLRVARLRGCTEVVAMVDPAGGGGKGSGLSQ